MTSIADGAFTNAAHLVSINIPATVKSIGTGVFAGCTNLVSITVSTSNTAYTSIGGVLFTKDKTILVCYPAARGTSSYLIGENVKKIDSYAFDGVTGLSKINYPGSAQSFQHIEIGVGNTAFVSLPVTCNFMGK